MSTDLENIFIILPYTIKRTKEILNEYADNYLILNEQELKTIANRLIYVGCYIEPDVYNDNELLRNVLFNRIPSTLARIDAVLNRQIDNDPFPSTRRELMPFFNDDDEKDPGDPLE
jgi:hypothetical protein